MDKIERFKALCAKCWGWVLERLKGAKKGV